MIKKVILFTISFVSVVCIYFFGFVHGTVFQDSQFSKYIYQAPKDDPNLLQWRRDWTKAGNSLVSAKVLGSTRDQLYVYLDYIYSGVRGPEVTTCGHIVAKNSDMAGSWSCRPMTVKRGRGFAVLSFDLLDSVAKDYICSEKIVVDFYDHVGASFFEQEIDFKKEWTTGKILVPGFCYISELGERIKQVWDEL